MKKIVCTAAAAVFPAIAALSLMGSAVKSSEAVDSVIATSPLEALNAEEVAIAGSATVALIA
ncbi:hypothetical protein [Amycolatopsis sp. cmx-11-12]|uniref:hypothetical protein n=1 Tax=Amycolatopsis sp. cmx-11-12 TaxID=2785795 RepID=UPI0039185A95